jgi:hypothetical protein
MWTQEPYRVGRRGHRAHLPVYVVTDENVIEI